jgi:hypothetical protein
MIKPRCKCIADNKASTASRRWRLAAGVSHIHCSVLWVSHTRLNTSHYFPIKAARQCLQLLTTSVFSFLSSISSQTVNMVRVLAVFSTLAVFAASAAASGSVPPDQAWQVVDTHTQQPDCLTATNRKCDVIDIAQVTQEGRLLAEKLSGHVHSNSLTAAVSFF